MRKDYTLAALLLLASFSNAYAQYGEPLTTAGPEWMQQLERQDLQIEAERNQREQRRLNEEVQRELDDQREQIEAQRRCQQNQQSGYFC